MSAEKTPSPVTSKYVQTLARLAGLELATGRAAALAPLCGALAEADRRLRRLPLDPFAASGPPWGAATRDG